ncbi:MAG: hypothetical protein R6X02_07055 [Enhygromyxa sp.]
MLVTGILEADGNLRKAISRALDRPAGKHDLTFNPESIAITSNRDFLIAGAAVSAQEHSTLEALLSDQRPLFLMYLSLPKRFEISDGSYVTRVVGKDRSVALVNEEGKVVRKGTLSFTLIGEDDVVAAGLSCTVSISTNLMVTACCRYSGSSGGVGFQVIVCIAFGLPVLPGV